VVPDPATSLALLRAFRSVFLVDNFARRAPATILWVDASEPRGRLRRRELVRTCAVELVPAPTDPTADDLAELVSTCERVPSDAYSRTFYGAHGSGRSVFVGDYQLKGVGRTNHSVLHTSPRGTHGRIDLDVLVCELVKQRALAQIASTAPLPDVAALVLHPAGPERPRFVLARRGSPLRVAHLTTLLERSQCWAPSLRPRVWASFLAGAFAYGDRAIGDTLLRRAATDLLARACGEVADARLFALTLTNWPDNADLFCRTFDCEEIRFDWPASLVERVRPRAGMPPRLAFQEELFTERHDHFARSLQSLHNAFKAIDLFRGGLGLSAASLDRHLTFDRLDRLYRSALAKTLARLLGVSPRVIERHGSLLAQVTRTMPLWSTKATRSLPGARILGAFRGGLDGGSPAHGEAEAAAHSLGRLVRAHSSAQGALALRERCDAMANQVAGDRLAKLLHEHEAQALDRAKVRDWRGVAKTVRRAVGDAAAPLVGCGAAAAHRRPG
jgi:hypothetical protein